jgi:FkbM family methyltransferase
MEYLDQLRVLWRDLRNPFPVVMDRLGLRSRPYVVRWRRGLSTELRPASGDRYGLYEVLRGDYTAQGQTLAPGDTVLDIGANIGCFSLLAATLVGPEGRVIAVEPEAATYQQLVRNIERNQLTNVVPCRCAVGGAEGTVQLRVSRTSLFSSVFAHVDDHDIDGEVQEVRLLTLETLMREHDVENCAYLKLDCEGAEYDILDSLDGAVADRVRQVSLEVHRVPERSTAELVARMASLGFDQMCDQPVHYYRRPAAPVETPVH